MRTHSSEESSINLHRTTNTASKATILVALLFFSPLLAGIPIATDEDNPMSSSTRQMSSDVVVTDLDVTTPSAMVGGTPTLAPVNHVIVVGTTNQGGSTAEGNVTLKVNGAVVDNRTATITPGGQVNSVMYWDASSLSGTGYEITASWVPSSSSSDSDTSNNRCLYLVSASQRWSLPQTSQIPYPPMDPPSQEPSGKEQSPWSTRAINQSTSQPS